MINLKLRWRFQIASFLGFAIFSVGLAGFVTAQELDHRPPKPADESVVVSKLAFGSCCRQDNEAPVFELIARQQPDLFVWLGDNIYGDTEDMDLLKAKYATLAAKSEYQALVAACPVVATWDDHDFGVNDGGLEYAKKSESKQVMLDFFDEPDDSERRESAGIYTSYLLGPEDKRVQLILLDLRTFRTKLKTRSKAPYAEMGRYIQNAGEEGTMLGEAQWKWLAEQLAVPARVRLIGMSTQFGCQFNGFESWINMPHEKQRLIELIRTTKTEGVMFLSGDTHWSEVSLLEPEESYPLYDFTSSSINQHWAPSANQVRVGPAYGHPNFGMLEIDWSVQDPRITYKVFDDQNSLRINVGLNLSQLTFAETNLSKQKPIHHLAGKWESAFGEIEFVPSEDGVDWEARYERGTCQLKREGNKLIGSWRESASDGEKTGTCEFELFRRGDYVRGVYGRGDGERLLAWPCWNKKTD